MKGVLDFIIQIEEPFKDKFKTESGMELFGDKRWMPQQLSNRIGKIINVPFAHKTDLKPGYEVLVDPTILYEQNYHLTHGAQESIFLVDKSKMYYKINPRLIVLYRETDSSPWKGYLDNGLYEKVEVTEKENTTKSGLIYIPENTQKKFEHGKAKLVFGNDNSSATSGQTVFVKEELGLEFFLDGKSYFWYRNEDVLAVIE